MSRNIVCVQVDGAATPYVLADYADAFTRLGHAVTVVHRQQFCAELFAWMTTTPRTDFVLSYDYWPFFPCHCASGRPYSGPFGKDIPDRLEPLFHHLGIRTVSVFGDDPFSSFGDMDSPFEVFESAITSPLHASFVWSPLSTQRLKERGCPRTYTLPLGFNPNRAAVTPRSGTVPFDFGFVGRYTQHRAGLLDVLPAERLGVYGDAGWGSDDRFESCYKGSLPYGTRALGVYRVTPVSIEIPAKDHYWLSQRCMDVWGSGGFLLSKHVDGYDEVFGDEFLVTFDDRDDLLEKSEGYLADERTRSSRSRRARDIILTEHTYEDRARQMVETLEQTEFL